MFFLSGALGGGGGAGPSVTVVVAATDIPPRASLRTEDLTTESVSGVFTNIYHKPSDAVNLVAQVNISKGTIITADMLVKDVGQIGVNNAPAYLPLAQGFVAITIPTSEQQGVAGHIVVGDYITMIATANTTLFKPPAAGQAQQSSVVKTVFTNLRIIGVGPAVINVQPASGTGTTTTNPGQVGGIASSLTLEVTQCDAEYLVWFLNNVPQLKYTLESFHDYLQQPTGPDSSCPNVLAAKGVTSADVNNRFHFV